MKIIIPILVLLLSFMSDVAAQNPGLVAKFGVDGELSSDSLKLGAGTAAGSHDWFKFISGTGLGLVDTTGTSSHAASIASGGNPTFTTGQSVPRFAIVDNMYMLDTRYGRDGYGLSATENNKKDLTIFNNGNQGKGVTYSNKNAQNPINWKVLPGGGQVQNKNDIVDVYAHMRRNGTVINSTNPSPLYLFAGATTVGIEGERNIDFEFFRSRISYNPATNSFYNPGPAETGGHSAWTFNPDGTVKTTGDMLVSFNYNTTSVHDIIIFIWVAATVKNTVNPLYFDFIPSEYFGDNSLSNPPFGYCRITQNGGMPNFEMFATTNTTASRGPFWGTNSKNFGVIENNYAANNYFPGQFSEIAINLTSLGIDPALGNSGSTTDPCAPPFTRLMVKTRASNSYTSELKDFTGPYPFLDAPQVPHQIAPANLSCASNTTTLRALTPQSGAFYTWSTMGGTITSHPMSESITVSGTGKYYLTASVAAGCTGLTDSIVLTRDDIKPVASANTVGHVNWAIPSMTAQIRGGDDTLSKLPTPFGPSSGLIWQWSGPSGFASSMQDTVTNREGVYRLILTEMRNGCKDTAYTNVFSAQTLPVTLTGFDAILKNQEVHLDWSSEHENNFNYYEVQRSRDGGAFSGRGIVFGTGVNPGRNNYVFKDPVSDIKEAVLHYRLKMVDHDGKFKYSDVRVIRISKASMYQDMVISPNPVSNQMNVTVPASWQGQKLQLDIFSVAGNQVQKITINKCKQTESINVTELPPGVYVITATSSEGEKSVQKIIKK